MKETLSFLMETKGQEENIQALAELMQPFSVSVTFTENYLYLEYDKQAVNNIRTRGAGRKSIISEHTIREVFEYSLNHSTSDTAVFAGVSLRSFQRHVARYKENGIWCSESELAEMLYFGQ